MRVRNGKRYNWHIPKENIQVTLTEIDNGNYVNNVKIDYAERWGQYYVSYYCETAGRVRLNINIRRWKELKPGIVNDNFFTYNVKRRTIRTMPNLAYSAKVIKNTGWGRN